MRMEVQGVMELARGHPVRERPEGWEPQFNILFTPLPLTREFLSCPQQPRLSSGVLRRLRLTVSWQVSLGEASLKFILINFLKSQILSVFTRKTSNWHLGVVEMHFGQLFEDSNFKCIYQKNYHGNLILTFGGDGQWIYFITALRKRLFYLYAS